MRRFVPGLALAVASLVPACGARSLPPTGELILYVDTDAPLPPPPGGRVDPLTEPAPMFDRLQVEVYPPDARDPCRDCVRQFSVDRLGASSIGLSVGIPLPAGRAGYRVRVRLFRGASTRGDPAARSTLEVVASLPSVGAEGVVERHVSLLTDSVGTPTGSLDGPVDTEPGAPRQSRVGTWPGARRRPCAGTPRAGEACVPGGAFWMGNALAARQVQGNDVDQERLVVVAPYFLDRKEVTVAAFRAFAGSRWPMKVSPWSAATSGNAPEDYCTFTALPSNHDDLPVNCVPWDAAREYCTSSGADLPTEAQFEYAAGAMEGRMFVWGRDEPSCHGAVWGQAAGVGMYSLNAHPCGTPRPPGGPSPAGHGDLDRLDLPTGSITDLAGNLSEWALDEWNRQGDACWSQAGVITDPLCAGPSLPGTGKGAKAVRGGNWLVLGAELQASARGSLKTPSWNDVIGFRCARSDAQ